MIKLVWFFGKKFRCDWVFSSQFLLNILLELMVVLDWMMFQLVFSGLFFGLRKVSICCFWQLCMMKNYIVIVIGIVVDIVLMIQCQCRLLMNSMKLLEVRISMVVLRLGCFRISMNGVMMIVRLIIMCLSFGGRLCLDRYQVIVIGISSFMNFEGWKWIILGMLIQCVVFLVLWLIMLIIISSVIFIRQFSGIQWVMKCGLIWVMIIIMFSFRLNEVVCFISMFQFLLFVEQRMNRLVVLRISNSSRRILLMCRCCNRLVCWCIMFLLDRVWLKLLFKGGCFWFGCCGFGFGYCCCEWCDGFCVFGFEFVVFVEQLGVYYLFDYWGGDVGVGFVVFYYYCYCDLWVVGWCEVDEQGVVVVLFEQFGVVVVFVLFDCYYLGGIVFVGDQVG